MPNTTTGRTRVVLPFGEREIESKYNYEKDTNLNHRLRDVLLRGCLQRLRM